MDTARTALVDPEQQFVGCLLWLTQREAHRVLAGMRADDLAQPMAAHVLQLVIEVVATGHKPAPAVVLAHAQSTGQADDEHRRGWLGMWLAEAYGAADPTAYWVAGWLKPAILEAAWRRALAEHARRLLQAVHDSPADVLADLADDTELPDHLWRRYRAALTPMTRGSIEEAA